MEATLDKPAPVEGQRGPYGRIFHDGKWRNAPKQTPAGRAVTIAPAPESAEGDVLDSQDDIVDMLSSFAEQFKDAKGKRAQQSGIAKQVLDLINKMDASAYPELFADEKFQALLEASAERVNVPGSADMPPGTTVRKGPFVEDKVPWRARDIWDPTKMEQATVTPRGLPNGKLYVNYNGLDFVFQENVTVTVPKCFVDIMEESYKRNQIAGEHAALLFRQTNTISDPNMLDPATMRVRGGMNGGSLMPFAQRGWEADEFLSKVEGEMAGEVSDEDEA